MIRIKSEKTTKQIISNHTAGQTGTRHAAETTPPSSIHLTTTPNSHSFNNTATSPSTSTHRVLLNNGRFQTLFSLLQQKGKLNTRWAAPALHSAFSHRETSSSETPDTTFSFNSSSTPGGVSEPSGLQPHGILMTLIFDFILIEP